MDRVGGNGHGGDGQQDRKDPAALEERIEELGLAIESLKSREQGAPLEAGCAFFSIFGMIILVIALFATVAKRYFGGWLFYLALAVVVVVGLARLRHKLMSPFEREQLRVQRRQLEDELVRLEAERDSADFPTDDPVSPNGE